MTTKARPVPTPKKLRVTDNVPEGAEVRMPPPAIRLLVELFGEEALRRVAEKEPAREHN